MLIKGLINLLNNLFGYDYFIDIKTISFLNKANFLFKEDKITFIINNKGFSGQKGWSRFDHKHCLKLFQEYKDGPNSLPINYKGCKTDAPIQFEEVPILQEISHDFDHLTHVLNHYQLIRNAAGNIIIDNRYGTLIE